MTTHRHSVKIAVVPKHRKDYRRALQMLLEDRTAYHAAAPYRMGAIAESKRIAPGEMSALSPVGVAEAYFGASRPAVPYASMTKPTIAVPRARALEGGVPAHSPVGPRTIPNASSMAGGMAPEFARDWIATPHAVPLQAKDTVIAVPGLLSKDQLQESRLRTIDPRQYYRALQDVHGMSTPAREHWYGYADDAAHAAAQYADRRKRGVKVAAATPLQPHQQRVVDRLQQDDQPGLVAIHGLGSGKTLTSIAAADALGRNTHAIVPASLQQNYLKELEKHEAEITPDLSTLQAVTRRGELPAATDEDFLVIDEAHRLREPGTKGYQTVRDIPAAKRLLLTASPTYNRPSDIAPLVNIAAGKRVLPGSQQDFEARYVGQQTVDPGFIARVFRGIQPGSRPVLQNTKELGGILKKWTDYHENPTDTADFPTRIDEVIEVPMSDTQQDVYKTITGKAPAWVQYKIRKGLPPSKAESQDLNAFLTGARQAQLSPGVFQQGGAPAGAATKQRAAFERFKASLEANPDHKAVVYSNYLDAGLSPYRQMLDEHHIPYAAFTGDMKARERAQAVKDYNEGKLRALLVSSAGGEGLDLKGTRQMQILEPHFNQEKLKQVIGRGIRYQSHADLPEDQRRVAVEQYLSTMPKRTGLKKFFLGDADTTADQYLHQMSQDKERLNQQLHDLLRGQQR